MSGNGLLNYRQADPALPFQPAGGASMQVEGQVSQAANATGGQFLDRMVGLPDTEVLLGRPLRMADVVVGMIRHENAKADLSEALKRRSE